MDLLRRGGPPSAQAARAGDRRQLSTGLTIAASIAAPAEEAALHQQVCGLELGHQAYLQATVAQFDG